MPSSPSRSPSLMTSFTTFDDALRSLSASHSALALETARASLEQAVPAPTTAAAAVPSSGAASPDLRDFHARRNESLGCPFDAAGGARRARSPYQRRPSVLQRQHIMTAPGLLEARSQRSGESEGHVEESEEEEAQQRAAVVVASPQRAATVANTEAPDQPTAFDYNEVINSYTDCRPSYATLNFSSDSSSSSGSGSIRSGSTDGSASSSDSSSTVTAASGFSTGTTPGVGRRASAPAVPTLATSSWSSFCPLARLPSYDGDDQSDPPPPKQSGGGVGDSETASPSPVRPRGGRRANAPSALPLTPFPHHHSSPYSQNPPSPYANASRRGSAMAAPCSPASSSRSGGGRDYMNPHTPPRTPPGAAAIMIAALERRRSESGTVTTRNNNRGITGGSGTSALTVRERSPQTFKVPCASCGRCRPEKSRYCCGWPPVHMVLFHGASGRGWACEDGGNRTRMRKQVRVADI